MVVGDLLGEICFDMILLALLHIVFELAVQVLMNVFGLSRNEAEGSALAFLFFVVFLMAALTAYRRKKLGKAVVLDTDGDGRISEEEEAAAFGIDLTIPEDQEKEG
tara:strand:+ start:825 stop:1142 length:318 start_codon:yes stop_codon:yes gene_type:complete